MQWQRHRKLYAHNGTLKFTTLEIDVLIFPYPAVLLFPPVAAAAGGAGGGAEAADEQDDEEEDEEHGHGDADGQAVHGGLCHCEINPHSLFGDITGYDP